MNEREDWQEVVMSPRAGDWIETVYSGAQELAQNVPSCGGLDRNVGGTHAVGLLWNVPSCGGLDRNDNITKRTGATGCPPVRGTG